MQPEIRHQSHLKTHCLSNPVCWYVSIQKYCEYTVYWLMWSWVECGLLLQLKFSSLQYNKQIKIVRLGLQNLMLVAAQFIVAAWARVMCLICMPKAWGLRAYCTYQANHKCPCLQLLCNTPGKADSSNTNTSVMNRFMSERFDFG